MNFEKLIKEIIAKNSKDLGFDLNSHDVTDQRSLLKVKISHY